MEENKELETQIEELRREFMEGKEKPSNPNLVPGAIIVAGIIIAGALFYSNGGGVQSNVATKAGTVGVGHLPVKGDNRAKVTIVEFADFQCPYCGAVSGFQPESPIVQSFKKGNPSWQPFVPGVLNDYVKTGKAKFAFRHFAFLGQESTWAAEAAECANEQGKFWEMHDYLFSHQGQENSGAFSKDKLEGFARALGLNTDQFKTCLETDKYADNVKADIADGQKAGVDGTPATFINGQLVLGAQPYEAVKAAIDKALQGK